MSVHVHAPEKCESECERETHTETNADAQKNKRTFVFQAAVSGNTDWLQAMNSFWMYKTVYIIIFTRNEFIFMYVCVDTWILFENTS